jgi:superfamily II DNA/RNA helicase
MHSSDESRSQSSGFREMGIKPALLKILSARSVTQPTPIQRQAIPHALKGKDLIGIAQTGTGKTFAFGLPMLQQLAAGKKRGLVILPTRELAYQIEEALQPFTSALGIRTAVFVGGAPMHLQRRMIRQNPRILIATPGRLNDHLQQGTVTLKEVEILVLDEADRMLDMGFKPQINRILKHVPRERQTLLFSATMPQGIVQLATAQMHLPLRIEVAPSGTAAAKVEQELIIVRQMDKQTLLISLLKEYAGQVLVFSRVHSMPRTSVRRKSTPIDLWCSVGRHSKDSRGEPIVCSLPRTSPRGVLMSRVLPWLSITIFPTIRLTMSIESDVPVVPTTRAGLFLLRHPRRQAASVTSSDSSAHLCAA